MKKLISTLVLFALVISLYAQNQGFRYQTVLRDATRQYLVNQEVDFRFSILEGDVNGEEIYVEEHIGIITNEFGLVNLTIGEGEAFGAYDFIEIEWLGNDFFLQVEISTEEESSYLLMGVSPLLPVPIALHEIGDFDRSSSNEIQILSKNGDVILLSSGGQITLNDDDPDNEVQTIERNGDELVLSINNSSASINDADASPVNEIQTLSVNNDSLIISEGNSVALNTLSPWIPVSGGINYPVNRVGINRDGYMEGVLHIAGANDLLRLHGSGSFFSDGKINFGDGNYVYIEEDSDDDLKIGLPFGRLWIDAFTGVGTSSPNAKLDVQNNFVISNSSGASKVYGSAGSTGSFETRGSNGYSNIVLGSFFGNTNHGWLGINNASGISRIELMILSGGAGYGELNGPNGFNNIRLTSLAANNNYGCFSVCDDEGVTQAQLCVADDGEGNLWCSGSKNFRIDHPTNDQKEIWYACIEGPEAAAYDRGTAQLENGEIFIPYSEHFGLVINPETVTVILTPHSAETYGLAVVEKSDTGFYVKEFQNGTGSFNFDWEVKGVRKGFEDYKAVRDKEYRGPLKENTSMAPNEIIEGEMPKRVKGK